MPTQLNPYLSFKDNARQAMEFYKSVFGGELRMNTFKEYNLSKVPADDDKIMHAELNNGNGFIFMAADTPAEMEHRPGSNITMCLSGENEKELKGYFEKLSSGGKVAMPLKKEVWGDQYGMLTDKFGVDWMVNISAPKA